MEGETPSMCSTMRRPESQAMTIMDISQRSLGEDLSRSHLFQLRRDVCSEFSTKGMYKINKMLLFIL